MTTAPTATPWRATAALGPTAPCWYTGRKVSRQMGAAGGTWKPLAGMGTASLLLSPCRLPSRLLLVAHSPAHLPPAAPGAPAAALLEILCLLQSKPHSGVRERPWVTASLWVLSQRNDVGKNGRARYLVLSSNSCGDECILLASERARSRGAREACLAWDNHPNPNSTSNSYLLGLPGVSPLLQPRYGPGTPVSSGYLTALS